jgi:hypothetical protein
MGGSQQWGPLMPCKIDGCTKPLDGLGYCSMHLMRLRRHGDAERERRRNLTKSPVYIFWKHIRRKHRAVESWMRDFEAFERECPPQPDSENQWSLIPIDASKPIGPGNAEWKLRHKRGTWSEAKKERNRNRQRLYRAAHPERVKNTMLKRQYGITMADYLAMHNKQSGLCAICSRPETAVIRGRPISLAVDHCHTTGAVRRLLCSKCNLGIGSFNHDRDLLAKAIKYLDGA